MSFRAIVDEFTKIPAVPESMWLGRELPAASFMHGRAGLAFLYAEHGRLFGDARSVATARRLALDAAQVARTSAEQAFGARNAVGPFTVEDLAPGVFTGVAGIGYATAVAGAVSGDPAMLDAGERLVIDGFERHLRRTPRLSELLAGTAGFVALADDLERRGIERAAIRQMGEEAARLLTEDVSRNVAPKGALGTAHGRTGELLVLLRRARTAPDALRGPLDDLRRFASRAGRFLLWPVVPGGAVPHPFWGSFCNGVVGQALLFTEAARRFGDARYRDVASGATASLLGIEPPPGTARYSVCCGEAGQAIALDRHGSLAASRAEKRAGRARLVLASRAPKIDTPSLFQGRAGIAWLAMLACSRQPLSFPLLFEGRRSHPRP